MTNKPKVGVGVIVNKNGKILFGKRKNSHGDGTWAFPGGHLKFMESLEDCVKREILEETGINVKNIKFCTVTNDFFPKENKHYITIFMKCKYESGELRIMEPHKCEKWDWFDWENQPTPLFISIQNLLKQNFNPFKYNLGL